MKFYDDKENIISNYERCYNNIVVKYLDGEEKIYNAEEKNNIETKMIEQAQDRDKELYEEIYWKNKKNILKFAYSFIPMIISLRLNLKLIYYVMVVYAIIKSYDLVKTNVRLKELKKYRLFLEMRKELEKNENSDITKVVEMDPYLRKDININTLDEFSYTEVKDIKKELKRRNKIKGN